MRAWGRGIAGTRYGFRHDRVAPWLPAIPPRREADRDAAELRAVAERCAATRAVGVSRGARALLGVLAEGPGRFERTVLVLPPRGTAAGRYREWLACLATSPGGRATTADVLILAQRGDGGHPVSVAEDWASRLGASLDVFPSQLRDPGAPDRMRAAMERFLDRPG